VESCGLGKVSADYPRRGSGPDRGHVERADGALYGVPALWGPRDPGVGQWRGVYVQRAFGDIHSARTVCRFITQLRRAADTGQPPESQQSPYTRPQGPSARAVSFTMVCPYRCRSSDAQTYLDQLCQVEASVARADALSQAFLALVRERRGEDVEAWMSKTMHSGIAELARFARGLQDDLICAGCHCSSAPVHEHHILVAKSDDEPGGVGPVWPYLRYNAC